MSSSYLLRFTGRFPQPKVWLSLIVLMLLLQVTMIPSQAAPPQQKPDTSPVTAAEGTPTDDWAVELTPGADPDAVAVQYGFQNLGQIGTLQNFYLFRRPAGGVSTADVQGLENEARVLWSERQVARQHQPRIIPTDPLYSSQWHLNNTGQSGGTAGQDVNIVPVWNSNITGNGVVVAVVDDGLQHTHPDFSGKYIVAGSYDFNDNDGDPSPNLFFDFHGTAAAGVAVAGNEGTCGVGSAFGADVSGLRLIAAATTDAQDASALTYQYQLNDIYSNSWGPADNGTLAGPGSLTLAALQNGVASGRGGRGNIYIWAAGNGLGSNDNVNYDGYANSRFTIAVGAVDHDGRQSNYSEPGAAIVVTAPSSGNVSGITTTDLLGGNGYSGTNCTNSFGGTSSAAPLVSGIVALMLEANPNLTWRDVQHILIETAEKNDPFDSDWKTNGAGYPINHKYGFGRIDADAAVTAAETWVSKAAPTAFNSGTINVNQAIPDDDNSTGVTSSFVVGPNITLEHVEVVFNATHSYRGNLKVVLTSPSGTQSILAEAHQDSGDNYSNWRFMSVRHWGESSQGTWTLKVTDETPSNTGTFVSWQLVFPGAPVAPPTPDEFVYLPLLQKSPPTSVGGFTNSGFESGSSGWVQFSSNGYPAILNSSLPTGIAAHNGSWLAWLGGLPNEITYVRQQVTIPAGAPYLAYWRWIDSIDACGYDFGGVLINNTVVNVYNLCSSTNTGGWQRHVVNLSAYAGQNVNVQIRAETDGTLNSNLFIDDVSFQTSAASTPATIAGAEGATKEQAAPKPGQNKVSLQGQGEQRVFPVNLR